MKSRLKNSAKIIGILLLAVLLSIVLFYILDKLWDYVFMEWFEYNFMETWDWHDPESNVTNRIRTFSKPKVKRLIFIILVLSVVCVTIVVMLSVYFQGEKIKKKTVAEVAELIRNSMRQDKNLEIFPDEYGKITAQMADIRAEMLRKEQILKEESSRKNDLIAYLAHDLKTPLTSVIGYLSLLDEAPEMPANQKEKYVKISLEKALRLEKLINEFFEITRYDLQQITLEKERTDIFYMLLQMQDEFYPILNEHGNTITLEADEDLYADVDAIKMARVFNNILKNAVAYSYPDTVIRIMADHTETEIKITFQNRGKTIPEQKLGTVFEKFFRLDEARVSNTGGAGLGLAIAKEIVVLHGGRITASSKEEVTAFTVILPM